MKGICDDYHIHDLSVRITNLYISMIIKLL